MRISTKLIAITLGSAVIVGGLVTSLLVELNQVSTGYTRILQGPVLQAEQARLVQVDFEVQVEVWKNILLRGQNPKDLVTYTEQFHSQEAKIRSEVETLIRTVDDPVAKQSLKDFLVSGDALNGRYQAAYEVYMKGPAYVHIADEQVRGQARAPSALFDKAVAQLNARAEAAVANQKASVIRQLVILLIVVTVLLIVDSVVYCSVLFGVLNRLGQLKAVSDRLAVADIEGLSIDISGNDEIGEIGESMKGVGAALHELLAVHAH